MQIYSTSAQQPSLDSDEGQKQERAWGATSSRARAGTSARTAKSSTTGLGAKWKCDSASSRANSACGSPEQPMTALSMMTALSTFHSSPPRSVHSFSFTTGSGAKWKCDSASSAAPTARAAICQELDCSRCMAMTGSGSLVQQRLGLLPRHLDDAEAPRRHTCWSTYLICSAGNFHCHSHFDKNCQVSAAEALEPCRPLHPSQGPLCHRDAV